jgi:hypothetical protein
VDKSPALGSLEPDAVVGLGIQLTDIYGKDIPQVWYLSIYVHFILFRVGFEDGLSISFLKNRASLLQKCTARNRKLSKKVKRVQRPPAHFFSHLAFFQKDEVIERVQSRFYSLIEIIARLRSWLNYM